MAVAKVLAIFHRHRLALSVGATVCLLLRALARRRARRPRGAKFVPGHWLLGNLPELVRAAGQNRHLENGLDRHQELGRTLALKSPLGAWSVKTTAPENVEYVLKTNFQNYPKGEPWFVRLQQLLGNGIFNVDGALWHSQRKISSQMFTAKLFKDHIWTVVRRNARKLRDILESTQTGQAVDIFNLMNRFTLDTIGEIGFGTCIGSLEDPSSPFLMSFDRAQQISFWRFVNPLWWLFAQLGLGPEKETSHHFGLLDDYSRRVVRELCAAMQESGNNSKVAWADIEARKSFVGLFLEDAKKRGETLSEDYLRDLVLNFLIAGRDTTAQVLSWTVYCLCLNPEAAAKARKEVVDVCGVRGPLYEDMPKLQYLQAVLSETLRLYPSVPVDNKTALADDILPDGTFVPAGTKLIYDIYSMGRDPATWGDDANVFRPERWLEMSTPPSNYAFPVFNAGPRECLGKRLAMVEMKTCLAMLLPTLSFELAVPPERVTTAAQLTIGMGNGLPCFVSHLSASDDAECNASTTARSEGALSIGQCTDTTLPDDASYD